MGGKPLMSELIPEFILNMGKRLEDGRVKYGYKNWRKCSKDELFHYESAMLRHAFNSLESTDEESEADHLIATAINAMFIYYLRYNKV